MSARTLSAKRSSAQSFSSCSRIRTRILRKDNAVVERMGTNNGSSCYNLDLFGRSGPNDLNLERIGDGLLALQNRPSMRPFCRKAPQFSV